MEDCIKLATKIVAKLSPSLRYRLKSEKLLDHHHDEHMTSKRFSRDVVNKYLNLMKPKGSKQGDEKVSCQEQSSFFIFSERRKTGGENHRF